jgi:hypothetical protein
MRTSELHKHTKRAHRWHMKVHSHKMQTTSFLIAQLKLLELKLHTPMHTFGSLTFCGLSLVPDCVHTRRMCKGLLY